MKQWHAWLELARISNLPTVWTNVIAGWLLAGGEWRWGTLAWLLAGGSLLYTAGMILNDAMDVKFDREHRKERPIPSGRVSVPTAWCVGLGMMLTGAALCFFGAGACGWLVLALVAAILAYDAFHKPWAGSVFIMGSCRTLLYLVAGSAAFEHFNIQWHLVLVVKAVVLGGYVVGLSLVARSEASGRSVGPAIRWLGWFGLGLPLVVGLAIFVASLVEGPPPTSGSAKGWINVGGIFLGHPSSFPAPWHQFALLLALGVLVWSAMRAMRVNPPSSIGRAVGMLLAGIVVVDGIAISPIWPLASVVIAASMPLLLLWQRKIAAT
jgi:hypothetical protein